MGFHRNSSTSTHIFWLCFLACNLVHVNNIYKECTLDEKILNKYLHSLLPVWAGSGNVALFSAWILAALFAVNVNAVCGTSRGINGIKRLPSICHSELTSGPQMLQQIFNKLTATGYLILKCKSSKSNSTEPHKDRHLQVAANPIFEVLVRPLKINQSSPFFCIHRGVLY